MYAADMGHTCGSLYQNGCNQGNVFVPVNYGRALYSQSACIGMEGIDLSSLYNCILLEMKYNTRRDRT